MVNRAARAPREDLAVKGPVVAGARAVSLGGRGGGGEFRRWWGPGGGGRGGGGRVVVEAGRWRPQIAGGFQSQELRPLKRE